MHNFAGLNCDGWRCECLIEETMSEAKTGGTEIWIQSNVFNHALPDFFDILKVKYIIMISSH